MEKFIVFFVLLGLLVNANLSECSKHKNKPHNDKPHKHKPDKQSIPYEATNCRAHTANLSDFGGVGDGVTLNTAAFNKAIANLSKLAPNGGALLFVPAGRWLTGSFSLISAFTLYIHKDAVLLASEDESEYPIIDPLPSYGKGRDGGKRFRSLIFGTNLTDVVITGGNGTIDGQGEIWWKKFKSHQIKNTRPYLIEIMYSNGVQISNLSLVNSPSWNVHPVYCQTVIIEYLTISAPVDSPNTDGINPDSCKNTRIRDSYVISGDDCIAVKSGWDEYGIKFGMPTENLSIKRFACISPDSAVIALGSEMSGGIRNVRADGVYALDSQSGVRIKTGAGRGAYVMDIYVRNMVLNTMKYVFWMTGNYGSHPDSHYDPNAYPNITNINYRDIVSTNVTMVGNLQGIAHHPFTGICISNVTAEMAEKKHKSVYDESENENENKKTKPKLTWNCSDIQGKTSRVTPKACDLLPETPKVMDCDYPKDILAIDKVVLKKCYV